MGGNQGQSVEQVESQLPDLWNVAQDYSGQLQPFDWSPLDPSNPENYRFENQSDLGPGNQRVEKQSFELLMDDLTRRIQARIQSDRAQMGDIGWSTGETDGEGF